MNKKLEKLIRTIWFLFHEHKWQGRLKFLFENNHADSLMIVFSGFAAKPSYNYIRTLKGFKTMDKLFILDDFGLRGSYYWFENKGDKPLYLVKSLISNKLNNNGGGYKHLYTMGTSKGGTCAIYYGLMFNAEHIYSGACQYYAGNYLNKEGREPILAAMIGEGYSQDDVERVNSMMPQMLQDHANCKSKIHLLYSKNEHTYDEHIQYLIEDLKKYNIIYTEKIEDFTDHNDVGNFFIPYIKNELQK